MPLHMEQMHCIGDSWRRGSMAGATHCLAMGVALPGPQWVTARTLNCPAVMPVHTAQTQSSWPSISGGNGPTSEAAAVARRSMAQRNGDQSSRRHAGTGTALSSSLSSLSVISEIAGVGVVMVPVGVGVVSTGAMGGGGGRGRGARVKIRTFGSAVLTPKNPQNNPRFPIRPGKVG